MYAVELCANLSSFFLAKVELCELMKKKYKKLVFGDSAEVVLKSLILSFFSPLLMYPPREQQYMSREKATLFLTLFVT